VPSRVALVPQTKRRDLLTLRNGHGNALQRTLSDTPDGACLQTLSLKLKFPVSLQTAAEATQIGLLFFLVRFLADAAIESLTARWRKRKFLQTTRKPWPLIIAPIL